MAAMRVKLRDELRLHRLEDRRAVFVDLFDANAGDGLELGQRAWVLDDDGAEG